MILYPYRPFNKKSDIIRLVERTVEEFGGMDHLVTSAGGPPSGPFLETTDEDWYDAFDLLVMSVSRLVRESVEHLQADDGGTIVNITSRRVKEAISSLVLSNSVRMGVIGLEKTLSRELAPEVRANAILPVPMKPRASRTSSNRESSAGSTKTMRRDLPNAARGTLLDELAIRWNSVIPSRSSPHHGRATSTASLSPSKVEPVHRISDRYASDSEEFLDPVTLPDYICGHTSNTVNLGPNLVARINRMGTGRPRTNNVTRFESHYL